MTQLPNRAALQERGTASRRPLVAIAATIPDRSAELRKLVALLESRSESVEFWCWARTEQDRVSASRSETRRTLRLLLTGQCPRNYWIAVWYVVWMVRVSWRLMLSPGGARYVCERFESAFPAACVSLIRPVSFLYLDSDNISLSHRWPSVIRWILERLERFTASRSRIHVVPSRSRWRFDDANLRILKNWPTTQHAGEARRRAEQLAYRRSDDVLNVYVSGWLPTTRGLRMIREAAQRVVGEEISFIVAGQCHCDDARLLASMPNVEYLGSLDSATALAQCYRAHVVLAFYDPQIAINRVAEPNKWYDCIVTGTPFITNHRIETALPYIDSGVCWAVDYGDADRLVELLRRLDQDRSRLDRASQSMASMQKQYWDVQMNAILDEFTEQKSVKRAA